MATGSIAILVGWNVVAIPVAIWLLSKRDARPATRSFRRSL